MKTMKIGDIKPNKDNPRTISDSKLDQLVKSIQDFPQMLSLRPIVLDDTNTVLGGNMRLQACKMAGIKDVPVLIASELTEDQKKEFIIKDNVGFGEWDWDTLNSEWNTDELEDWGLEVPVWDNENEWGEGEGEHLDEELESLIDGEDNFTHDVKRAIQIEFTQDQYKEAYKLINEARDNGLDVGGEVLKLAKTW